MFDGQTINFIYILGIFYTIYNISSSISRKKRLGEVVLDIDDVKSSSRIIVVAILTILISYMIYLSLKGYSTYVEQATVSGKNAMLINLLSEIIFWISIYSSFMYAQFGKRYIGKEGLSIGTKGYIWREIKQFSWKENELAITVEEKVFFKLKERGIILNIPMEKVKDTTEILRGKVKR